MISKSQLNMIANSTGLNLYQQEKDYLLKLFLYFYYKRFNDAIFKGGTCLKYIFGLPRFSEDLDFNVKNSKNFRKQINDVLKNMNKIGIKNYFIKEEIFSKAYTCEIGFEGPLYAGSKQSQNKFRIDSGLRTGVLLKPEWRTIKSEYPETNENFLILTMNVEEILIEKISSLFQRKKGRDLYDIWFIINSGVEINKKLLKTKMLKEKAKFDINSIVSERQYNNDMKRLTNIVIPYKQIKEKIIESLKDAKINIDRL